ncbi:DUF6889 family protein [Burkholderia sp. PAMC 28687]|uniref:DUF6889 family protein n=1 Tax=Burkholderia sp. PAMC 28687 TaxID=1795874 RepID=UPI000A3EB91D|nr:hypothetical protein [Burkholderia sp. PAMC 28687]
MAEGEDWVMRPCVKGMCLYESMLSGKIGMHDIARMNEALDVVEENRQKARALTER